MVGGGWSQQGSGRRARAWSRQWWPVVYRAGRDGLLPLYDASMTGAGTAHVTPVEPSRPTTDGER